jgi:hypothetical protein
MKTPIRSLSLLGPVASALLLGAACAPLVAAPPAPNRPPPAKGPPEDWRFAINGGRRVKPAPRALLDAPAAATGDYDVARTPPDIQFFLLPGQWPGASLWSSWGDARFGSDTNFYCSIGDHAGPHGYTYVYKVTGIHAEMIVDVNRVLAAPLTDYAPGKIHAPLMEFDGWLYFAGYRGGKGADDAHHYTGDPLIRWHLVSGQTERLNPPAPYCSVAASVIHAPSQRMYGVGPGGERQGGKSRFFVYDLVKRKTIYCGDPEPDAARAIIVAQDGRVWYSSGYQAERKTGQNQPGTVAAPSRLVRFDPATETVVQTGVILPGRMLRAASRCNREGIAYGITWDGVLFAFDTHDESVRVLCRTFDSGPAYTAVCKLSPDERYLYFMPGAHGGAQGIGCPVIQYDTRTNRRKVIAFLFDCLRDQMNYLAGGAFGLDISPDGATLGICLNGRAMDETRSAQGIDAFDQCSVVRLEIPPSER